MDVFTAKCPTLLNHKPGVCGHGKCIIFEAFRNMGHGFFGTFLEVFGVFLEDHPI